MKIFVTCHLIVVEIFGDFGIEFLMTIHCNVGDDDNDFDNYYYAIMVGCESQLVMGCWF